MSAGLLGNASILSVHALRNEIAKTKHWSHLFRRINEASGPYQMSCGALLDGIVYDNDRLHIAEQTLQTNSDLQFALFSLKADLHKV